MERRMQAVARELRKNPTFAEDGLWQAIRKNQVDGRKFRRQVAIGAFIVDFYCASERLAVEVDGSIHERQQEADRLRQELIESLGIRFVRLTNDEVAPMWKSPWRLPLTVPQASMTRLSVPSVKTATP